MSLSEKLDAIRAGAEKQIPPPARELMQRATQELQDSGAIDQVIEVGSPLPDFSLKNQYGDEVSSTSLLNIGPIVMTVYRGLW